MRYPGPGSSICRWFSRPQSTTIHSSKDPSPLYSLTSLKPSVPSRSSSSSRREQTRRRRLSAGMSSRWNYCASPACDRARSVLIQTGRVARRIYWRRRGRRCRRWRRADCWRSIHLRKLLRVRRPRSDQRITTFRDQQHMWGGESEDRCGLVQHLCLTRGR